MPSTLTTPWPTANTASCVSWGTHDKGARSPAPLVCLKAGGYGKLSITAWMKSRLVGVSTR